jgi:hypothetical protein
MPPQYICSVVEVLDKLLFGWGHLTRSIILSVHSFRSSFNSSFEKSLRLDKLSDR